MNSLITDYHLAMLNDFSIVIKEIDISSIRDNKT